MVAILSLLTVLTLSILVTRIATVELSHTGLSRESAVARAETQKEGPGARAMA